MKKVKQLSQKAALARVEVDSLAKEMAKRKTTTTSGEGDVKVQITGSRRIRKIRINPDLLKPENAELIEDLIIQAANEGLDRIELETGQRLREVNSRLANS